MVREFIIGLIVAIILVGSMFISVTSYFKIKSLETRVDILQTATSDIFKYTARTEELMYSLAYLSFTNIKDFPQDLIETVENIMEESKSLWDLAQHK